MIPQGEAATMVSKAALSTFILRILVLIASIISVALVASSHSHAVGYDHDIHYDFKNIITLRYVMAVAVMSLVYGVVQLPFAASYLLISKRLIPHPFEFYADKVLGMFLATGSGAGIAVSREFKKELLMGGRGEVAEDTLLDPLWKKLALMQSLTDPQSRFWSKLHAASVFLLLAWLFLVLISIISYHHHHHHHNKNANTTLGNPPRSDGLEEPSPKKEQHTHVPTTDDEVKASSHDDVCV